jgi:hypothetical protein
LGSRSIDSLQIAYRLIGRQRIDDSEYVPTSRPAFSQLFQCICRRFAEKAECLFSYLGQVMLRRTLPMQSLIHS